MKTRSHLLWISVVAVVMLFSPTQRLANSQTTGTVLLSLSSDKNQYLLGEIVSLKFRVTNSSPNMIELKVPSVETGSLKVLVAQQGEKFKEYRGPYWGLIDARNNTRQLKAGEVLETSATLLYHHRTQTSHLTPLYADAIRERELGNEFALDKAGLYRLKAVFSDSVTKTVIESAPLDIQVVEPTGEDAKVWEVIKNDGANALFLQTGAVKYRQDSDKEKTFKERLGGIFANHPTSVYSEKINVRLKQRDATVKIKADEKTRCDAIDICHLGGLHFCGYGGGDDGRNCSHDCEKAALQLTAPKLPNPFQTDKVPVPEGKPTPGTRRSPSLFPINLPPATDVDETDGEEDQRLEVE